LLLRRIHFWRASAYASVRQAEFSGFLPDWPSLENILPESKTVCPTPSRSPGTSKATLTRPSHCATKARSAIPTRRDYYTLPEPYPVFHVTAITHRKDAVYPATIVGMPPMEDFYIGPDTSG
jgi:hypothetical protein